MEERGLAPMVSTILLIAVFALAATAVGTVIASMWDSGPHPPLIVFGDFKAESSGSATTISFSHIEGETVNPSEIRVVVSGQNSEGVTSPTILQISSGTSIEFGDRVEVTTSPSDPYYPQGNEVTVSVTHIPSGEVLVEDSIVVENAAG